MMKIWFLLNILKIMSQNGEIRIKKNDKRIQYMIKLRIQTYDNIQI